MSSSPPKCVTYLVTALPPNISVEAEVLKEEIARSCLWFSPMHVDRGPVRWLPSARYGKGRRRTPVELPVRIPGPIETRNQRARLRTNMHEMPLTVRSLVWRF
jgi:hypothetical protein